MDTILVIDDEVDITQMLAIQLRSKGYNAVEANDGLEALEKLKTIEPSLIILDLGMPKMGGIEFYQNICNKEGRPKYPVFVLTGRSQMEALFKDFYVDGFITKPFELEKLMKDIEIIVKRKHVFNNDNAKEDRSKFVTIVEDDPTEMAAIAMEFKKAGYHVNTAATATDGLISIVNEPPGIALIQLGLKDIPGDTLVLRLMGMEKVKGVYYFLILHRNFEHHHAVIKRLGEKSGVEKLIEYIKPEEILESVELAVRKIIEEADE